MKTAVHKRRSADRRVREFGVGKPNRCRSGLTLSLTPALSPRRGRIVRRRIVNDVCRRAWGSRPSCPTAARPCPLSGDGKVMKTTTADRRMETRRSADRRVREFGVVKPNRCRSELTLSLTPALSPRRGRIDRRRIVNDACWRASARKSHLPRNRTWNDRALGSLNDSSAGLEARLHVSQDGRRYLKLADAAVRAPVLT
jgi:hypothetical protein